MQCEQEQSVPEHPDLYREHRPDRGVCELREDAACSEPREGPPQAPREVSALPGFSLASQGISLAIQCQPQ